MLRRSQASGTSLAAPQSEVGAGEDRNYRTLLVNGAIFGFIDGGIATYLPVLLARLGAGPSLIGLLTAGPSMVGILAYLPGGIIAERHSDLVRLVVRAWSFIRLSYLLIALLPLFLGPAYLPAAAVLLWTIGSAANGVSVPAWTTVIAKAVPPERRARLNGIRWATYSLVCAAAIAGFGYFLDHTAFPRGYQAVFVVSFLAGLVHLYTFSKVRVPPFVAYRSEPVSGGVADQIAGFFRPLVDCRDFVRYNMATLGYRLVFNMPVALYSIYWVDELRATDTWIGLRGTVGYAGLVVGYRVWGLLANRIGHRTVLLLSGAGLAFYPVLTALAPTPQWLLPGAVVWGLGVSGLDIGFFDMLLAVCPEGRQPRFSATANVFVSFVTALGPLLGAGLAHSLQIRTALYVIGGLQLLSTGFFFLLPNREQEGLFR
jgi:MFS family permease